MKKAILALAFVLPLVSMANEGAGTTPASGESKKVAKKAKKSKKAAAPSTTEAAPVEGATK